MHVPDDSNRITHYRCGLVAGQRVRLKKDLIVTDSDGKPSGKMNSKGEQWVVLTGVATDPVFWFVDFYWLKYDSHWNLGASTHYAQKLAAWIFQTKPFIDEQQDEA